jgi:threonine synthase
MLTGKAQSTRGGKARHMRMLCPSCRSAVSPDDFAYRCNRCDEALEILYDLEGLREEVSTESFESRPWDMWRYSELLPVARLGRISLQEGGTPLHEGKRLGGRLGLGKLYLKDETRNPTGSFKDRGSSVGISKAVDLNARAVGCVSTGNMAASMAAYAAKAGLKNYVLVPTGAPVEKMVQTMVHGAVLIAVSGEYPKTYRMGLEASARHRIYMVHSDAPFRVEGQKTIAYEICEQLDWTVPDYVVVPTSSGGNISAIWKGFKEMYKLGIIGCLPSMVSVQAEGCSPIVEAFKRGSETIQPISNPGTLAQSISNPDPPSGRRVLRLLRDSKGLALSVSDQEILEAQRLLAETEGLFVEPASASAIAAVVEMSRNGTIDRSDRVVCILTGSGLKDVKSAMRLLSKPLEVNSQEELDRILGQA